MARKVEQPNLSLAEIEILKERIGNMTPQEQEIVASELQSSVMENELAIRRATMGSAVYNIASEIRKIGVVWAQ